MPADVSPLYVNTVYGVFLLMTLCTLGGAMGVVTSRTLFHSALFLILSFFGVAGYYVLLSAGFLAIVQLVVYIGAIAILILFAIMFSHNPMAPHQGIMNRQAWLAFPVAAAAWLMLLWVSNTPEYALSQQAPTGDTVQQLGLALGGSYLIPFEVVGVLLSLALVGAIVLAREKTTREEQKTADLPEADDAEAEIMAEEATQA